MRLFIDMIGMIFIGVPVAVCSFLWQHARAGWALGEWTFSPDSFCDKYGGKYELSERVKSIREAFRK